MNIIQMIAGEFNVKESQVENTVLLLMKGTLSHLSPDIEKKLQEVSATRC